MEAGRQLLQVVSQIHSIFADSTNAGNYFAYNLSWTSGATSYLWDFGDGTTSTQQYPFHQYAIPGQYIVCLTVTGTYGAALGGLTTCSLIHTVIHQAYTALLPAFKCIN